MRHLRITAWSLCGILCFPAFALAQAPLAQAPLAEETPLKIQIDEIRLEGTVRTVDFENKNLVLEATTFTLPSGKSSRLPTPRPKTLVLGDKVLLFVRGVPEKPLPLKALQAGQSIIAVGKDSGSGQPLTARAVAVWDSIQDGQFRLKTAPKTADADKTVDADKTATNLAPQTPDPTRKTGQVVEKQPVLTTANEVPHGDFETFNARGQPLDWIIPARPHVKVIKEENGNRYVNIRAVGPNDERKIATRVLLAPEWKSLKITARLRVRGMKLGDAAWDDVHLGAVYFNARDEAIAYTHPVRIAQDMDWKTVSGISTIAKGAKYAMVDAGIWGRSGELDIDDLRVEADGTLDAPPLPPGFPQGTFEKVDDQGHPLGWDFKPGPAINIVEEDGNRFLRLSNSNPHLVISFDQFWSLDPAAKQLRVRVRLRGSNLKIGKEIWENARLGYVFTDVHGERAGDWPPTADLREDSNWKDLDFTMPIPPGARLFKLTPILHNTTGTLDVDDIQIDQLP